MATVAEATRQHMQRALALAKTGWGRVSPNPLVGAVVVQGNVIVGEGFHAEYGGPHAEIVALRAAGERAHGATLYVTLEPCSHYGKTPPCTDAIIAAGIHQVVYAAADPNPTASGGAAVLRQAGIEVVADVEELASRDLNAPFFHRFAIHGTTRPWIQLKLALSLDARMADLNGRSTWITGETARAEVHRLRARCDGIAVGIGTVLADDPLLTVRGPVRPRTPPVRVVFDTNLRTPVESRLLQTSSEAPVWLVSGPYPESQQVAVLESAGARVVPASDTRSALRALREAGIGSLFCEGGATLAGVLIREDVVDRLDLFYAPLFLGPQGRHGFDPLESLDIAQARRWRHLRTEVFGDDTVITLAA
jgi:diaminohydroxyphosphoribosylaminopyrimidine deaminase/5-amino-6-(5-phosphoribosylamino)uracil reductase